MCQGQKGIKNIRSYEKVFPNIILISLRFYEILFPKEGPNHTDHGEMCTHVTTEEN